MTYDIHIQPVPEENVHGFKCMEFGYTAAVAVEGLQELINRWVKVFLTPVGSCPLHLDVGTELHKILTKANLDAAQDLQSFLEEVVQDTNEQVIEQDTRAFRDAESSLGSATIVRLKVFTDRLDLWVRIINANGDSATAPLVIGAV